MTFEAIVKGIQARDFKPVYFLMGDEGYYSDAITNMIVNSVLPVEERDFNQTVVYGLDTDVRSIISMARAYPMMSDYQVVVVKEAQQLNKIEELNIYAQSPLKSTILVINYKNGTPDKRRVKGLLASVEKHGAVLESKKIPDYKMGGFITSFVKERGKDIDAKSSQMLADYLGNDLTKLSNEVDKLIIAIPPTQTRITADIIEENIGISKDFNNFELLKAVVNRDVYKANQIADYFESNPRNNPMFLTLIVLFNFFSNLMICYWARDKSERGLVSELRIAPFQARDYVTALKHYNAFKSMEIINLLRTYDGKGKGVDNSSTTHGELLRELLYKMMH